MYLTPTLKRYGLPIIIALATMVLYQVFVSPVVRDVLDDWTFLHAARHQPIQQGK